MFGQLAVTVLCFGFLWHHDGLDMSGIQGSVASLSLCTDSASRLLLRVTCSPWCLLQRRHSKHRSVHSPTCSTKSPNRQSCPWIATQVGASWHSEARCWLSQVSAWSVFVLCCWQTKGVLGRALCPAPHPTRPVSTWAESPGSEPSSPTRPATTPHSWASKMVTSSSYSSRKRETDGCMESWRRTNSMIPNTSWCTTSSSSP